MTYSEEQLKELRGKVSARLSEKRFLHTLGVERAATFLAKRIIPEKESEIRAAALLHDITKELTVQQHVEIIKAHLQFVTESDMLAPAVYHSLTAPYVITRDFPDFSDKDILSAVLNHTIGAPDMSVFEEIIFISDYIEDGRTYPVCVSVRENLMSRISVCSDPSECIAYLHEATIESLDNTIISLVKRGDFLHEKTVMTRNAFLGRKPMPLK